MDRRNPLTYIKHLVDQELNTLSLNLDPIAVAKIQNKGMDAICCRAEELNHHDIHADVFLLYETLEHIFDPVSLLKEISEVNKNASLVVTVPYRKYSQVGLHQLRGQGKISGFNAERTHIFELCPEDWCLLFKLAGWEVQYQNIYLQYPKWHPYYLMKPEWARRDFEGFYGVVLSVDSTYSEQYMSW